MFYLPWRKLWTSRPGPSRARRRLGAGHVSYRPQLEPLEDRLLPTLGTAGIVALSAGSLTSSASTTLRSAATVAPAPALDVQPAVAKPPAVANQMKVTINENSTASVIELSTVFAAMSGIHPKDGLQLSILGNTNSGLVTTDLSGADLKLTYARGKCGTATITVGATDADGMSVREAILVTVLPLQAK